MNRILAVVVIGCFGLVACDIKFGEAARPESSSLEPPIDELVSAPVSVDELRLALSRSDPRDIAFALNEVRKTAQAPGVLEIIECAYTQCDDRDDNWDPAVFEREWLRVDLLSILSRNLYPGGELDRRSGYRSDAIAFLASDDPRVFRTAMTVLARVGRDEDTVRLEAKALEVSDDVSLNIAVASLASMSNGSGRLPEAQRAIDRIRDSVGERRRAMIDDLLEQMR
ncbi:MAG: hypothetical protein AAF229_03475 [Pseudomonadota bacterium]